MSFLNENAQPSMVERAFIRPPQSSFTALSDLEVQGLVNASPFYAKYAESINRESAHELFESKMQAEVAAKEEEKRAIEAEKAAKSLEKEQEKAKKEAEKVARAAAKKPKTAVEKATESFINTAVRTVGRELAKSLLGSLKKK